MLLHRGNLSTASSLMVFEATCCLQRRTPVVDEKIQKRILLLGNGNSTAVEWCGSIKYNQDFEETPAEIDRDVHEFVRDSTSRYRVSNKYSQGKDLKLSRAP